MASGMEMALKAMLNNFVANLPPEIRDNIDNIGRTVVAFKTQMDRIERNQHLIMAALKIDVPADNPPLLENGATQNGKVAGSH